MISQEKFAKNYEKTRHGQRERAVSPAMGINEPNFYGLRKGGRAHALFGGAHPPLSLRKNSVHLIVASDTNPKRTPLGKTWVYAYLLNSS